MSVTKEGVVLTDRGKLVLERHPARLDATEAIWRERYGENTVGALRDALTAPAVAADDRPDHVMWSAAP